MATPEELEALAPALVPPNSEIMMRAAKYLRQGAREGLEVAHNLLTDIWNNYQAREELTPDLLRGYMEDLRQDRIEVYGSVGRQPDMAAPFWKRGW